MGRNPVLAHLFLEHLLDPEVALANLSATGYQPPQNTMTAESLVADEYIPKNLSSAAVLPGSFEIGYRTLELPPETEAKWQAVWQRFKAGA
jgi:spermidine/putrescine transport system substrate-binding protein